MRILIPLLLASALGCQISPEVVTTDPSQTTGRYDDCRRAARDYCRYVVQASDAEKDRCVAEQAFACLRGSE